MDLDNEVMAIRSSPIFEGLCKSQSRILACMSEQLKFAPGEFVVREGEPSDSAYLILEGEVEYVTEGPGGENILGRQGKGTLFGEVSLLCDRPRYASIRALKPLSVMRIDRDELVQMMNDNPAFSLSVARELAERVLRFAQRINAMPH